MTDISTNQPATVKNKLIKTGFLSQQQQSAGFVPSKPSPLLKQPLGSVNTNLNNQNNNYYYEKQNCHHQGSKCNGHFDHREKLSDDALKSDVQIVLNNIQNAILNQQKNRQQQQQERFYQHQDRFKFLNIFGGSPSNSDIATNQRNNNTNNNLYLRKMSMSPAECDNTNNNNNNNMLGCSFTSDFTHDNSDYQWFIDYG